LEKNEVMPNGLECIRENAMQLKVINPNEDKANEMYASSVCQGVIDSMNEFYPKIGFHLPWVGYFVLDNYQVVGTGGFTGPPKDGRVEIAYWTFKGFEGKGVASFVCRELVAISRKTGQTILVTAKTSPEHNSSTHILQKNGFEFSEVVQDHEIGNAWLWVLK
jgi:[ribosomal protein S5]-alanine N-acetyltransferase